MISEARYISRKHLDRSKSDLFLLVDLVSTVSEPSTHCAVVSLSHISLAMELPIEYMEVSSALLELLLPHRQRVCTDFSPHTVSHHNDQLKPCQHPTPNPSTSSTYRKSSVTSFTTKPPQSKTPSTVVSRRTPRVHHGQCY